MKVPDFVRADINRQDQELKKYGKAGTAFDEHLKLIKKIDSKEIHVKMVPTLKSNKEHPLLPKKEIPPPLHTAGWFCSKIKRSYLPYFGGGLSI